MPPSASSSVARSPRVFTAALFALFSWFAPALPAAAEVVPIGQHGATLELGEGWERKQVSADFGKDQFSHPGNNFAMILELPVLLESREDFEELLEGWARNLQGRLEELELDEPVYFLDASPRRASRRFTGRLGNLHLAYRLDVIGRDGLGYLVMTWGARTQAEEVYAYGAAFAASLKLPGPDTEWGRSAVATPVTVEHAGWTFGVAYQKSLWRDVPAKGAGFFAIQAGDEDLLLFFLSPEKMASADASLDASVGALHSFGVHETERGDITISGIAGRRAVVTGEQAGARWDFALIALPLGDDGRFLDVRFGVKGPLESRAAHYQRLLDTLTLTPPPTVDAFPAPSPAPSAPAAPRPLPAAVSRLLEAATRVADLGSGALSIRYVQPAGQPASIILCDTNGVYRATIQSEGEGEGAPTLVWKGTGGRECTVRPDGKILVSDSADDTWLLDGAEVTDLELETRRLASAPDGRLLLLRRAPRPDVVGFGPWSGGLTRLVVRSAKGDEQVLAEVAGETRSVTLDLAGRQILVVTTAEATLGHTAAAARETLLVFDLPPAEARSKKSALAQARPLPAWEAVTGVAPAAGGWLVNGTPAGRPEGLYRLDGRGEAQLLIAGDAAVGIGLDGDDRLTFATSHRLPGTPASAKGGARRTAVSAPLAAVLADGAGWEPFPAVRLREIGKAARAAVGEPLASRAGLDRYLAAADAEARRAAGVPLPTVPDEVDELLSARAGEYELEAEGVELLAALLTRSLLGIGAIWVDGPASRLAAFQSDEVQGNDLAVAYLPLAVTGSTLYEEEGWWEPASGIARQAEGRTVLLGGDRAALEAAVRNADVPRFAELAAAGNATALARELAGQPANLYLRERIYRELAGRGHLRQLVELSTSYATEGSVAVDRRAWYTGRLALALEPVKGKGKSEHPLAGLVEELRAATAAHPDEAVLYLLLGKAYLAAGGPEATERARACFAKVQELDQYGEDHDAAETALAALDGGESEGE